MPADVVLFQSSVRCKLTATQGTDELPAYVLLDVFLEYWPTFKRLVTEGTAERFATAVQSDMLL